MSASSEITDPADGRVILELRRVSCAVSMSRFFGRLVISQGAVAFRPEGRANEALNAFGNIEAATVIAHPESQLTVITGRLLPPWMNSGLVLVDAETSPSMVGVLLLTTWQRRRIVEAARSAGFEVSVHRTWFSAGGGIGSVSELDRFRREHT